MSCRQRGSMLIELMTIVSATSVILLVSTSLIHRSLSWSKENQHRNDVLRVNSQLARSFRHDIHSSTSITIDNTAATMTVHSSTIRYQWTGEELKRTVESNDDSNSIPNTSETFRYGPDYSVTFSLDETRKLCSLQLRKISISNNQPLSIFTVNARPRNLEVGGAIQ